MSIKIQTIDFDLFSGDIQVPKKRVETFTRTDIAHAGAQVMPTAGQRFNLQTTRYEQTTFNAEGLKDSMDSLIGTLVDIIADGVIYSTDYAVKFIAIDVRHQATQTMVRARGYRATALATINYSPGLSVVSDWTLQATPFS